MKIQVTGINVLTIIGCNPDERLKQQQLVFDIDLDLYQYNHLTEDSLASTINYDELVDFVCTRVEKTSYKLLESLVQYVARELLQQYSLIQQLKVTVTKLAICGVKADRIQVFHEEYREFKVAIALGANLGLAKKQIISAIELLAEYVSDVQIGGFYETSPFGGVAQANFINTAIIAYTRLLPDKLFAKIKVIEKLLGKVEVVENGPRIIDIDLIFFSNWEYQYNFLHIPHPSCHLRDFVLKPLIDIDPNLMHPQLNQTISDLYQNIKEMFIVGRHCK